MTNWQEFKVPELRAELKRRDLPFKGSKATLVARLQHTEGLPLDYQGRKAHYQQAAKEYEAMKISEIVPFRYFTQLPLEIQRLICMINLHSYLVILGSQADVSIGEFSLPGPRVLKHPEDPICEHRLYFPKEFQPPNPAALSTCRESRAAALKRYKLCFGTTNLYADLAGGDILYLENAFVPREWAHCTTLAGTRPRTLRYLKKLCEDVVNDLDAVKHLILPASYWNRGPSATILTGLYTRRQLRRFKSLERVSLILDPKWDFNRVFAGYTHLTDPYFERPQISLGPSVPMQEVEDHLIQYTNQETIFEWKERRKALLGNREAVCFIGGFDLCDLSEPEAGRPIPAVRVVELEHTPYLPKRVEERGRGYPIDWCCDTVEAEDQTLIAPRTNARYGLRSASNVTP